MSLVIAAKVDDTELLLRMRNGQKRLAYAVVNAINATMRRVQEAERAEFKKEFVIRKEEFISRNAAVIKPFASVSQARPYAEIAVGQKPRLLLSVFERGGTKEPATPGAKNIAVPVKGSPARPTFAASVPELLWIGKLRFSPTRPLPGLGRTKKGNARRSRLRKTSGILYGQQGTYLMPKVGVFQRQQGSRVRRLLYSFKPQATLKPRLHFVRVAQEQGGVWFKEEMEKQVINAIARDKGRSV